MTSSQLRSSKVLTLGGVAYRLCAQPAAPGLPYVRQGSQSVVYQLVANSGDAGQPDRRALKVFSPRFRHARLQTAAAELDRLADLPGLQVCQRTVLTPGCHGALLRASPELTYAIVMPWVDGPSWEEVVLRQDPLSVHDTLRLARGLAHVLRAMEQRGVAHCDVSGANVMLPALAGEVAAAGAHPVGLADVGLADAGLADAGLADVALADVALPAVALVDIEGLFGPGLQPPASLPPASDGYTHAHAASARWGPAADRFAGAVVLAEMLGWSDSRVRLSAWGHSFFDPGEMQRDGSRFRLLYWVLRELWGADLARLFQRAWRSETLRACPPYAEWLPLLQEVRVPVESERASGAPHPTLVDLPLAAPPAEDARLAGPRRRALALTGLGGVCAAACVVAGAQLWGALSPRPTERAVESTQSVPVPVARPATLAAGPVPAAATLAPTARPTLTSSPTPSVADAWDAALVLLDLAWGRDWPTTIDVLESFLERYPDYPPTREKLYLALVEHGKALIDKGEPRAASVALSRARSMAPDRAEAQQVLASLTPTPQPTAPPAPPEATPAPAAPAPTPAPASPPTTPAPASPAPTPAPASPAPPPAPASASSVLPEPPATNQPVTRADTDTAAPVDTVRSFYRLVGHGPGDQAADLWTPRLRALFPPAENITARFSHTRELVVEQADLVALDQTAGRATVAVVLREQLDSPPLERRYHGTWDLVRAATGWLLDQPDLRTN